MSSAGFVMILMILAPAMVAFPKMLRDGLPIVLAIACFALITCVWALAMIFILALAPVSGSAIPGPFWVMLFTGVAVVEILRLKPQRPNVRHDDYSGFKK